MLCCRPPQETKKTFSADKCAFLKDNALDDYFIQCHHSICAVNKYEGQIRLGHTDRFFLERLHWLQFARAEIKQDEGNYAWEPVGYRSLKKTANEENEWERETKSEGNKKLNTHTHTSHTHTLTHNHIHTHTHTHHTHNTHTHTHTTHT